MIDPRSRLRPVNLHPADVRLASNSQYFAGVMTGHKTSACRFQPRMGHPARAPFDQGPDRIHIRRSSPQTKPHPMISALGVVVENQRRPAVYAHHDVGIAVIVQVADSQTTCAVSLLKYRAAGIADISHLPVPCVAEQEE